MSATFYDDGTFRKHILHVIRATVLLHSILGRGLASAI